MLVRLCLVDSFAAGEGDRRQGGRDEGEGPVEWQHRIHVVEARHTGEMEERERESERERGEERKRRERKREREAREINPMLSQPTSFSSGPRRMQEVDLDTELDTLDEPVWDTIVRFTSFSCFFLSSPCLPLALHGVTATHQIHRYQRAISVFELPQYLPCGLRI